MWYSIRELPLPQAKPTLTSKVTCQSLLNIDRWLSQSWKNYFQFSSGHYGKTYSVYSTLALILSLCHNVEGKKHLILSPLLWHSINFVGFSIWMKFHLWLQACFACTFYESQVCNGRHFEGITCWVCYTFVTLRTMNIVLGWAKYLVTIP